jgi:hypothetical protein
MKATTTTAATKVCTTTAEMGTSAAATKVCTTTTTAEMGTSAAKSTAALDWLHYEGDRH